MPARMLILRAVMRALPPKSRFVTVSVDDVSSIHPDLNLTESDVGGSRHNRKESHARSG
jgi:hypothetical protein